MHILFYNFSIKKDAMKLIDFTYFAVSFFVVILEKS